MGFDTLGQVQMWLASGSLRAVTNKCGLAPCAVRCFLISTESLKMSHPKSDAFKFSANSSATDGNQQHVCSVPLVLSGKERQIKGREEMS